VGAGPYGLSLAAHLSDKKINFRIFGTPMQTWRKHMPIGMHLKSEGFASNLYEPSRSFTLEKFCRQRNLAYENTGQPVSLSTFNDYAREFQERFVPDVDFREVAQITRERDGFSISLSDGELLSARSVVIAVGLPYFKFVPAMFEGVPSTFATHSSAHSSLDHFRGKRVTVIGLGASATDIAGLLYDSGADVQIVGRSPVLRFQTPPARKARSFRQRLRNPKTGIGNGMRPFIANHFPDLIHLLPETARARFLVKTLGPAPCWFMRDKIIGNVPTHLGMNPESLEINDQDVDLLVRNAEGIIERLKADHIIYATGYRVDISRLPFLNEHLRKAIDTFQGSPNLSTSFESSVEGLYFIGIASAMSFGPLLRFVYGSRLCAERVSARLGRRKFLKAKSMLGNKQFRPDDFTALKSGSYPKSSS
jgi:thioredoxin reductase